MMMCPSNSAQSTASTSSRHCEHSEATPSKLRLLKYKSHEETAYEAALKEEERQRRLRAYEAALEEWNMMRSHGDDEMKKKKRHQMKNSNTETRIGQNGGIPIMLRSNNTSNKNDKDDEIESNNPAVTREPCEGESQDGDSLSNLRALSSLLDITMLNSTSATNCSDRDWSTVDSRSDVS